MVCSRQPPGILERVRMRAEDYQAILNARPMAFRYKSSTTTSRAFANEVTDSLTKVEERKRRRRATDQFAFELAVDLITADLLFGYFGKRSSWVYRSLHRESFKGEPVKADTFNAVIGSLLTLGLVEQHKGGNHSNPFKTTDGKPNFVPGLASRFRATHYFIEIAAAAGLMQGTLRRHYELQMPNKVIKLTKQSVGSGPNKLKGRTQIFQHTERTLAMAAEVKAINAYLNRQRYEGGIFSGLRRIFNEADAPGFKWDRGGRLYAVGDESYQMMKKRDRLSMRINGEPVVELDVNASFLRVFASMVDSPLPSGNDIYVGGGIHRDVIKAWVTATLGHKGFHKRWPVRLAQDLRDKGHLTDRGPTMKQTEEAACDLLPVMRLWPQSGLSWSKLMFKESESMLFAIRRLIFEEDTPCLPVHDSLIVPASAERRGLAALEAGFLYNSIYAPVFSVSRPPPE